MEFFFILRAGQRPDGTRRGPHFSSARFPGAACDSPHRRSPFGSFAVFIPLEVGGAKSIAAAASSLSRRGRRMTMNTANLKIESVGVGWGGMGGGSIPFSSQPDIRLDDSEGEEKRRRESLMKCKKDGKRVMESRQIIGPSEDGRGGQGGGAGRRCAKRSKNVSSEIQRASEMTLHKKKKKKKLHHSPSSFRRHTRNGNDRHCCGIYEPRFPKRLRSCRTCRRARHSRRRREPRSESGEFICIAVRRIGKPSA